MLAASIAILVWRFSLAGDRDADRLARAHAAIARGMTGEPAAFDDAEQALAAAASLTDAYPLFALEATRRLKERRFADAEPPVRAVFDALSSNDFARADAAVAALPPTLAGRAHLARFVAELRRQPRRPASSSPLGR